MNVTPEYLAEALEGMAVDVSSGTRVYSARLLEPTAVAAEVLRRVAELHPEPRELTPSEAAVMLHLSVAGLSHRARAGQIPHKLTPGGHRRYLETDIRALAQQEAGGT